MSRTFQNKSVMGAAFAGLIGLAISANAQVPPPGTNPFLQQRPVQPSMAPVQQGSAMEQYQAMGRRNMAEGDVSRAEVRFEEALQINPFDPVALNNLASARAEQGDYHSALDMLERAARLDENDSTIAANLARLRGWVNYYAGNEPHPSQLIAVPEDRLSGGLPPAPPDLWDPGAGRQQLVIPPNPAGYGQGTYNGSPYLFRQQGTNVPDTQVYDGAYIQSHQAVPASPATYGSPSISNGYVAEPGAGVRVQPAPGDTAYAPAYAPQPPVYSGPQDYYGGGQ